MKDISLYGHLTVDTILDGTQERKTLGSMANVWKALVELDSSLNIGLSPTDIGEALIYTDLTFARRYSKSSLNLKQCDPKIFTSKIHHLIYINEMTQLNFISSLNGIVTADVCSGKKLDRTFLKFVDYLFISDEDVDDFSSLVNSVKGWVILHRSDGSVFSNGMEEYSFDISKENILKNVNVLGSGDIFASCFLYKLLGGIGTIKDWIEFSHYKTTEILRDSI